MRLVLLTNGEFAKVDDEDFARVSGTTFHAVPVGNTTYARSSEQEFLHHIIVGKREGLVVDHRDNDGLNNQKSNLQHITQAKNIKSKRKRQGHLQVFAGYHMTEKENAGLSSRAFMENQYIWVATKVAWLQHWRSTGLRSNTTGMIAL